MAKWVGEIDEASRVPELVSRAVHVATSGRPGPVVLALPQDMLSERADVPLAPPRASLEIAPDGEALARFGEMLAAARRPVVLVGGSRWSQTACDDLAAFASRFRLPVVPTFRRSHLIDALHPSHAGDLGIAPDPKLLSRIKVSDLVILIGGRLGEVPSQGYSLIDVPTPQMPFVHVHQSVEELGRVYAPTLAVAATPGAFLRAVRALPAPDPVPWRAETEAAHADYLAWSGTPTAVPGTVNLGEVMVWLRETLPPDAILTNGAGNFAGWITRFFRYRRFGTQIAPTSGSMGYGLPAAVAMKRLFPERTVVAIAGDGDLMMTAQEFATAVQHDLPIVVVVCDNGQYGTIRMHQERAYPGRVTATALRNPDFAALARACGGFGVSVGATADFPDAFRAAQAARVPALIHLAIDPEAITPTTTLSAIRTAALSRRPR